jgi:hypothetical protein
VSGPPTDPRAGRYRPLGDFLTGQTAVVAVLAAVGTVLGGRVGEVAGGAAITLLVAIPLVRVAWLGRRWLGRGDARFAGVAGLVLAVVALGWALSG